MSQSNQKKHKERPSLMQIRYLMALEKIGIKRGNVMLIAEQCGVSHGPVSRFLKSCVEQGYLTPEYRFTEQGRIYLESYKRLIRDIQNYLEEAGVDEEKIGDTTRQLMENVDLSVLSVLLRNSKKKNSGFEAMHREKTSRKFLESMLEPGNCEVRIAIFQSDLRTGIKRSMASYGFEPYGLIRNNKRGKWLELTIREIQGKSRLSGKVLTGHMETLRYRQEGSILMARKQKDKVRIPLAACTFKKSFNGCVRGEVPIMLTASVGQGHMPESTAVLVFWL